ncbi:hypothetical protein ACOME3_000087 [Neoechinorhynchus agilis]
MNNSNNLKFVHYQQQPPIRFDYNGQYSTDLHEYPMIYSQNCELGYDGYGRGYSDDQSVQFNQYQIIPNYYDNQEQKEQLDHSLNAFLDNDQDFSFSVTSNQFHVQDIMLRKNEVQNKQIGHKKKKVRLDSIRKATKESESYRVAVERLPGNINGLSPSRKNAIRNLQIDKVCNNCGVRRSTLWRRCVLSGIPIIDLH